MLLSDGRGEALCPPYTLNRDANGIPDGPDPRCEALPGRIEVVTTYDANGWTDNVTDPLGNAVGYVYDLTGRKVQEIYPDDDPATPPGLPTKVLGYDDLGRLVTELDEAGHVTTYGHDALGRLTSVTDDTGGTTEYAHDALGNMTDQWDAEGRHTTYESWPSGQRKARVFPLGHREEKTYSPTGFLESVLHLSPSGSTVREVTYTPDARDLVQEALYPNDGSVVYTYWDDGQRETVTTPAGTWTYRHDEDVHGRLTRVERPDGLWVEHGYDLSGNRTVTRTGHGSGPSAETDNETCYDFDEARRLKTVTDCPGGMPGDTFAYQYDDGGRPWTLTYPTGLTATYEHSARGWLNGILWTFDADPPLPPELATIADFRYADAAGIPFRDADGVPHRMEETALDTAGATVNRDWDWTHDDLHRITSESVVGSDGLDHLVEYNAYDAVGNRLSKRTTISGIIDEDIDVATDDNDRLEYAGPDEYTFDDLGRLTRIDATEGLTEYFWDDQDRLVRLESPTETLAFAYDPDGLLVARIEAPGLGEQQTDFLLDRTFQHAVIIEAREDGFVTERYLHGLAPLRQEQSTGPSLDYVHSALSTTRLLLDSSGVVQGQTVSGVFGEDLGASGPAPLFRYVGEWMEAGAGVAYLRARWLHTAEGRFISPDPVPAYPYRLDNHPYVYASGQPLRYTDPTGRFASAAGGVDGAPVLTVPFPLSILTQTKRLLFGPEKAEFNAKPESESGGLKAVIVHCTRGQDALDWMYAIRLAERLREHGWTVSYRGVTFGVDKAYLPSGRRFDAAFYLGHHSVDYNSKWTGSTLSERGNSALHYMLGDCADRRDNHGAGDYLEEVAGGGFATYYWGYSTPMHATQWPWITYDHWGGFSPPDAANLVPGAQPLKALFGQPAR